MPKTLLCAGVGQLNRRVAKGWLESGGQVVGFRLSPESADLPFKQVSLNLAETSWPDVSAQNVVIALSARERSEPAYRSAYVEPIERLSESLPSWRVMPEKIIVVSSTRVYGVDDGSEINDTFVAKTNDPYGQILLEMEALVAQLPVESSVVRLSGIYGSGRDWMRRMSLKAADQSVTKNHWTNRIHIDDASAAIGFLLNQPTLESSYIVSDRQSVPVVDMYNYFRQREGANLLKEQTPEKRGKRLVPSRLIDLGFQWQYPNAFSGGYE